jgi:hypothetical protein
MTDRSAAKATVMVMIAAHVVMLHEEYAARKTSERAM